ncbi:MAG: hypothetical protein AABN33_27190 [Acidobacteriota bacterium]
MKRRTYGLVVGSLLTGLAGLAFDAIRAHVSGLRAREESLHNKKTG